MAARPGWQIKNINYDNSGNATGTLQRRAIKPESVLDDLVESYTDAYNEGRKLNDQRYDDLVVLYKAVLSESQDEWDSLLSKDDAYEAVIEALISSIVSDHSTYAADVEGSLDDYGDSIRLQINTRFDNELTKAKNSLVSRGMYNSTLYETLSAGIERERTLALTDVEDKITQQQLDLKNRVHAEKVSMRSRILAARDRMHSMLTGAADSRLAARNAVVEALARFVERRTDSYPDLAEIGNLAASLGAGSPESYSP